MVKGMHLPRALRLLGYALCVVISAPEMVGWITHGRSQHGGAWLAFYALFIAAYHASATAPAGKQGSARRLVAMGVQEAAMIALAVVAPCEFAALALVVLSLQGALFLPPRVLAAGLVGQTVVVFCIIMRGCGGWESVSWFLAVSGFQATAAVAVMHARRETEARASLAAVNAELMAARALLADSSRADERVRIARELHDVLGHSLTALGLQLEVARNVGPDDASVHVRKAQALASEALAGVRVAVSTMRASSGADVSNALRALCTGAPGLEVHLELPDSFVVGCADRAHCVVRCVQEILTNTLRHAHAENLWISVAQTEAEITIVARDDGRGAPDFGAGNGLDGMRARLEEMGGKLAIAATPAFSLLAHLPSGEPA